MGDNKTLQILNCPFCGRQPEVQQWHGGKKTRRRIDCPAEFEDECPASPAVVGETLEEAIDKWNTRA